MATSSRRKGTCLANQEESPAFFKVVLKKALQDGKLEIQDFVAIKYRNFLARSVLLKVPNGQMWPIKLTRSDSSTWLEKGWLEFARFYSLDEGYFLFFSYESVDSSFHVRICNKNHIEINYPSKSSQLELPNSSGGNGATFSKADTFQSNSPFCAIKVHPSYIKNYLHIPSSFAKKYICRSGERRNVDLQIPNGETWSVECFVKKHTQGHDTATIQGGWTVFVQDNHLQVGDEIVLKMTKQQPKVTFTVHIYRS